MEKEDLDFLCEVVRFEKSIDKQCRRLVGFNPLQRKKMDMAYVRLHKMIRRYCEFHGIELPPYEGMEYEIGLPVEPLNLEDFETEDSLYIETVLEPVIKKSGSSEIIRNGKVLLAVKEK